MTYFGLNLAKNLLLSGKLSFMKMAIKLNKSTSHLVTLPTGRPAVVAVKVRPNGENFGQNLDRELNS